MKEKSLSIGLDFEKKYALVSYCTSDMSEPDTISTVAGSELYQIPLSLCKRRGIGQWYYGKEAETVMKNGEGSVPIIPFRLGRRTGYRGRGNL